MLEHDRACTGRWHRQDLHHLTSLEDLRFLTCFRGLSLFLGGVLKGAVESSTPPPSYPSLAFAINSATARGWKKLSLQSYHLIRSNIFLLYYYFNYGLILSCAL